MGAASKYTEEIAAEICEQIASTNLGLKKIAANLKITATTVYEWLLNENHLLNGKPFSDAYVRAREKQAERILDECLDIADDETKDIIKTDEGKPIMANSTKVQRDRLRIDTRKFMAAKLAPKKYGESVKIDHTSAGKEIKPSVFTTFSDETLRELIEKLGQQPGSGGEG